MAHLVLFFFTFLALTVLAHLSFATDPAPLEDFCVAELNTPISTNGYFCKSPEKVDANDFYFGGFRFLGNTSTPEGSKVTKAFVTEFPGLNTLGISAERIDYALGGVNPPHIHPRASELFTVIKGTLEVGFVTSNPENRLITKIISDGEMFVFPKGLVHFQRNVGYGRAMAISGLGSQNPGIIRIADSVFGSNPDISTDVLARAFRVDASLVEQLKSKF